MVYSDSDQWLLRGVKLKETLGTKCKMESRRPTLTLIWKNNINNNSNYPKQVLHLNMKQAKLHAAQYEYFSYTRAKLNHIFKTTQNNTINKNGVALYL